MRIGLKSLLVATLVALGGLSLGACSLQLPDGTDQEWWLADMHNPGKFD